MTGLVISAPMDEITHTDPCASAMPASVARWISSTANHVLPMTVFTKRWRLIVSSGP